MGSGAGLFAYFSRCEISIIYFPKQMYIKVAWVWLLCFRSGGLTNVPQTPTTMRGFKIKFALTRCIPCQCHATLILGHFFRKFPSRITSKIIGENSCQKGPRNIYTILKVQYLSKIQTEILEILYFPVHNRKSAGKFKLPEFCSEYQNFKWTIWTKSRLLEQCDIREIKLWKSREIGSKECVLI